MGQQMTGNVPAVDSIGRYELPLRVATCGRRTQEHVRLASGRPGFLTAAPVAVVVSLTTLKPSREVVKLFDRVNSDGELS